MQIKQRIKPNEITKIIRLRKLGKSINEIVKIVKRPKTTVYTYAKNITISPQYQKIWAMKRGGSMYRKIQKETKAFNSGKELIQNLTLREKTILLAGLYWAEGSKKDLSLSNTDHNLIQIYIKLIQEVYLVTSDRIRVSLRLYEDLDINKCKEFWAKITGIKITDIVSVNILNGRKSGKLKYGMCRVRVLKGGDTLKKINGIIRTLILRIAPVAQLDRASRS